MCRHLPVAFPSFQKSNLFTAAQTQPLAKSNKVTLIKRGTEKKRGAGILKKNKNKNNFLVSVTNVSQHLSNLVYKNNRYSFFYIFVQTFVWRAKLSHLVKPVCKVRHMRKQLGTNFKLHVISCFLS